MNNPSLTEKYKLNAILMLSTFCMAFVLSACMQTEHAVQSENPKSAVEWPPIESIKGQAFLDQCQKSFDQVSAQFSALETKKKFRSADDLLKDINRMDIVIDRAVSKASLYANVHPETSVRAAAEICEQKFVVLLSEIGLSRPLYNHLKNIETSKLNALDKRYVEHMLRDFRRSGVDKDESTRERIKALNEEINLIGQTFDKNIRDDVRQIAVNSVDELNGLPDDYIAAHKPNADGKIIITTTYPDYVPVMQYAHSEKLRSDLYKVFRQRGYPQNEKVLQELVAKRHELAGLLGYANTAEYVTEVMMIESPENAQDFIDRVADIASPLAKAEYQVLLDRLKKLNPEATEVTDWQKTYLEELIKQEKYDVDSRELRQYFSYQNVRQGIFDLTQTMFDVEIKPWHTEVWHESVEAYEIRDGDRIIGRFYMDMHPREGKYNHAAAFSVQDGVRGIQLPISALVCNFPGGDGGAGLMEHSDVETFLHEFGHLLHGIFGGNQKWLAFSGIKTEWDFVEAPSQMLQEWVWDAETLATFARNEQGEVIPPALVEKMVAGRDFGRGLWTRHQLFYAALSLNVYNRDPESLNFNQLSAQLQNKYSPFDYVDDTYFYTSFGHLNGYSAIYYTYMWSLVIAADMFSEFEQGGLRNPDVAQRYRKRVLEPGGSRNAADLVKDFLGRSYNFEAFAEDLNHGANQ
jgi:thimet oligopeptidase